MKLVLGIVSVLLVAAVVACCSIKFLNISGLSCMSVTIPSHGMFACVE